MLKRTVLCVSGLACIISLMYPTRDAYAQSCRQWSVDGEFRIKQGNGFGVTFYPRQNGGRFSGTGIYNKGHGTIEGSISSRGRFNLVVTWNNGSVGEYTGFVTSDGNIEDGRTFDRSHPANWSTWWNTTPLTCASE